MIQECIQASVTFSIVGFTAQVTTRMVTHIPPRQVGYWVAGLALTICSILLALVHLYKPRGSGLWMETFFNSAHVPVFAGIVLALFVALGLVPKLRFWTRISVAGAMAVLLAVLSEAAQIDGPRDASFEDLAADWLGSASMLLAIVAFSQRHQIARKSRIFWTFSSLILFLLALKPLIFVSVAYVERSRNFPILFDFDSCLSRTFLQLRNTALEVVELPTEDQRIGRVTFDSDRRSALIFHDLWADWSKYSALAIEFDVQGTQVFELNIRVHDRIHSLGHQPYNDRFNKAYTPQTGPQTIRIPLEEIRRAPVDRQIDLSQIHGLVLFTNRGEAGRSFELREIRLE